MKRATLALAVVGWLWSAAGCAGGPRGCGPGGCAHGGMGGRGGMQAPIADSGPASGAVTYPYYTTRGPRDFLARSPRAIGAIGP